MFVAKAIAKSKFKKVSQSISGDPDDQTGFVDGLDERGGVKWHQFNWPPYLNLVHFSPWTGDNIPLACKKTASVIHYGYRLTVISLTANFLANIIFKGLKWNTTSDLIGAIFQCLILVLLCSFCFHWGYRGIAGEIRSEGRRYLVIQSLLCVLWSVFIFIDYSNIHGFASIGKHSAQSTFVNQTIWNNGTSSTELVEVMPSGIDTSKSLVWDVFAVCESCLWSLSLLFTCGGLWRAWRYPGHTIAFRREQPVNAVRRKGRASDLTIEL